MIKDTIGKLILQFMDFSLAADVFPSTIGKMILKNAPYKINLTRWGNEVYGPINLDIEQENSIDKIPAGGLAYSKQGNYFCIFFGQNPAWPVEYFGQIEGETWKRLLKPFPLSIDIFTNN